MSNTTSTTSTPEVKTAFTLIVGTEAINKSIKKIQTTGKTYDNLLHLTACSILDHVHLHRETSLITKLLAAVSNCTRKNALISWFAAHAEAEWNAKTKSFDFMKNAETLQAEAEAMPFWEYKPEPPYKELDLDKAIADLVKRVVKRNAEIAEAKAKDALYEAPDKINPSHLKALQEIVQPCL